MIAVVLRPLDVGDLDAHMAGEDEHLIRWLHGGRSTREGTADYLRHCTIEWRIKAAHRAFGIRADGELAGTLDLRFDADEVAIAYGLYPAWRGRGLATRSVLLACAYAASEGARTAVIKVEPANTASSAVALRAGFTLTGTVVENDTTFSRHVLDLTRDGGPPGTAGWRRARSGPETAGGAGQAEP
ncbi:GNAT family N-acetyltransferase [Herbidospora mongoliensis]|uniref:GNAT family N-acetyltransferase n=1 Tax=Herbidospora mongoliensis TaxID=688067 RepID=UPI00082E56E9|nr:GNAT family N-acetyltransferase [Herbidospora mongoliensis]